MISIQTAFKHSEIAVFCRLTEIPFTVKIVVTGGTFMYKCSVKAQLVLDQVRARCQSDTQTNNKWYGRSGNYMYIMGRENADGKATGVVHKFADDGSHRLAGSFKILSDGQMTRFTGMSSADWRNFMRSAEAEYKRKYSETETTATEQKVAV